MPRYSCLQLATSIALMLAGINYCHARGFVATKNYPTGEKPDSVAVADFNGDGKLDMVTVSNSNTTLTTFLGKGDGTFLPAQMSQLKKSSILVSTADLNGDGRPDLVMANFADSTISVLLNSSRGFLSPLVYVSGGFFPDALVIGDFDGDGIFDLAVSIQCPDIHCSSHIGGVAVLRGNGDGTFQNLATYKAGYAPQGIAMADFNKDGKPDIAIANFEGGVSLFLGNGDGTFQTATSVHTGTFILRRVATGDFNHDGNPDMATTDGLRNVTILLGNGDGTFQAPVSDFAGLGPESIVVDDFNGDGNLDLAVALNNYGHSRVALLQGNGDGTFPFGHQFITDLNPTSAVAADFNHDGAQDLVTANNSSNDASVLMNSGGTFITATSSSNPSPVGQPITFTAAVDPSLLTTVPTGKVIFKDGATVLGTVSLDPTGQASFTTSSLTFGTHTIQTKYSGDANYNPNTGKPITQVVQ